VRDFLQFSYVMLMILIIVKIEQNPSPAPLVQLEYRLYKS
jgi:hypothetical protein